MEKEDQEALKWVENAEQIFKDDLRARDGQRAKKPGETQQKQNGGGCTRTLIWRRFLIRWH